MGKTYHIRHKSKKAANAHKAKIEKRGGKIKQKNDTDGSTSLEYKFD